MSILYLTLIKGSLVLLFLCIAYFVFVRLGIKKFFPMLLIIVLGTASFFISPIKEETPPPLTLEEKQQIVQEQMDVSAWYNDYKKDLEQMDINWQQYHRTLKAFNNDEISIQTVYMRLFDLQKKTAAYKEKYDRLQAPGNLQQENEDLAAEIIRKTNIFATQQDESLKNSLAAITSKNLKTQLHSDQVKLLEKIMILDNPASLNIAAEVSQLRANLIIPGEN